MSYMGKYRIADSNIFHRLHHVTMLPNLKQVFFFFRKMVSRHFAKWFLGNKDLSFEPVTILCHIVSGKLLLTQWNSNREATTEVLCNSRDWALVFRRRHLDGDIRVSETRPFCGAKTIGVGSDVDFSNFSMDFYRNQSKEQKWSNRYSILKKSIIKNWSFRLVDHRLFHFLFFFNMVWNYIYSKKIYTYVWCSPWKGTVSR